MEGDLHLHLFRGAVGDDPALIHQHVEAKHILVEAFRRRCILRLDIGHDAPDLHGLSASEPSAAAP
ncbi:hypothetical protein ACVILI_000763 [Mesorhizobium sp. USDA 4775]